MVLILSQGASAQSTSWMSQSTATKYADNLISTYNAEITATYGRYPDLAIQHAFPLYEPTGYSFRVVVMRWNSTYDGYVGFAFSPIIAPSNEVVVSNETVLQFMFGNLPYFNESLYSFMKPNNTLGFYAVQGAYNGSLGAGYLGPIWLAVANTLYANPLGSSASAGVYMFQHDQKAVPPAPSWIQVWWPEIVIVIGVSSGLLYLGEKVYQLSDRLRGRKPTGRAGRRIKGEYLRVKKPK